MKKLTFGLTIMIMAFSIIGGTAYAAQGNAGAGAGTGTGDEIRQQDRVQDPTLHTGDEPLQDREQVQDRLTSSTTASGTNQQSETQARTETRAQVMIEPEHVQVRASSSTQLGQIVQVRERELAQEAASTSPANRAALENANQVRLTVHALLASENLLGPGIGQQVSQIAQQMNDSIATTTNAEVQIRNRSFWTRLFFGGDTNAARTLTQEVNQNQNRIQAIMQLLGQASTTLEVKTQLQTQLTLAQEEQARLSKLAEQERSTWGIFSWRF